MNALNQFLYNGIINLAIFYCLICAGFYFLSNGAIFLPPKPTKYIENNLTTFLPTSNQAEIASVYYKSDNSNKVILFSHGNAEDLSFSPIWAKYLNKLGLSVFAYDYQGYGLSSGKPSEKNTYDDIKAAYDHLINKLNYKPEQIILYGRSLGSGPTVDLASKVKVGAVILEAPFATAFTVVTHIKIIPFDKFANINKIKNIKAPILIMHGTKDGIISFKHGQKLFQAANEPKQFYPIKNAGHNDIIQVAGEGYWQAIVNFIDKTN
jgi:fermentation-respiration switch protein FrsA (DUF1100 family)